VGDQSAVSRRAAIAGVGMTRQGRHPGVDRYRLAMQAIKDAVSDAGVEKAEIDGVLTTQQFDGSGLASLELSRHLGINPRVTAQLDYSTAAFTTQYAAMLVASGVCDTVLCAYGRNPPGAGETFSGAIVWDAPSDMYQAGATAGLGWTRYLSRYGGDDETLGRIAVTAREHARRNPNAAFTDPLTLEDYLAQPHSIWPLRELDICRLTAGAVALIVTTPERARATGRPVVLFEAMGRQQAPRRLENDEHLLCLGMRSVAEQVYGAAGIAPGDVDVLGIYDAATPVVVHTLENYGFCEEGGAADFIARGSMGLDGATPVNPDGGHMSAGYLVGWTHHVELVRQLRGEAGERQVAGATIAQFTSTGRFREDYASTIYVAE
jgi:acetyl-CoA acetyltransferase